MKKNACWVLAGILTAGCFLLFIQGCIKGSVTGPKSRRFTYTLYTPIYQLKQSVLSAINGDPVKTIDSLGKIFILGNFVFLNDVDKGIHIIDNSDPAHPVQTAFLNIPGNQDIAVKGNMLYADMYSDLLAIDISDPHHVQIKSMVPALFTEREYVNGFSMDSSQVIISWIKKDTTVTIPEYPPTLYYLGSVPMFNGAAAAYSSASNTTGIAGSTTKMVLINNYLYAITERHSLGALDISHPSSPVLISNKFAGFDLETIYPFKDKLFLGSDIGTFIYDLGDPGNPTQTGQFTHGQACDPVITDGTNAYITLHSGTSCGGAANELDVVDVRNLQQPSLLRSYPMISPTGLSKDGNLLFVCDGPDEVKLYDAGHPENIQFLSLIKINSPYDVIAENNKLMVVANEGLYQYDYSQVNDIRLLSLFKIK